MSHSSNLADAIFQQSVAADRMISMSEARDLMPKTKPKSKVEMAPHQKEILDDIAQRKGTYVIDALVELVKLGTLGKHTEIAYVVKMLSKALVLPRKADNGALRSINNIKDANQGNEMPPPDIIVPVEYLQCSVEKQTMIFWNEAAVVLQLDVKVDGYTRHPIKVLLTKDGLRRTLMYARKSGAYRDYFANLLGLADAYRQAEQRFMQRHNPQNLYTVDLLERVARLEAENAELRRRAQVQDFVAELAAVREQLQQLEARMKACM